MGHDVCAHLASNIMIISETKCLNMAGEHNFQMTPNLKITK